MSEAVATQLQILAGSVGTVGATFTDGDGAPADPGLTTVGITDLAGTVIVPASTATATSGTASEVRSIAVSGSTTALLNSWVATWATANMGTITTRVEIVGALLFTIADARGYGDKTLASATKYPSAVIERKRADLTDQFADILGYAPVPRYSRDELSSIGETDLLLPSHYIRAVRSAEYRWLGSETWTALDSSQLAGLRITRYGAIERRIGFPFWPGTAAWRIGYEHGRWSQIPGDLRTAALMAARSELVDNAVSDRAISQTNEYGATQYWMQGMAGHIHYLPYVDEVLQRYRERIGGIA
jgi:hypothetical protein